MRRANHGLHQWTQKNQEVWNVNAGTMCWQVCLRNKLFDSVQRKEPHFERRQFDNEWCVTPFETHHFQFVLFCWLLQNLIFMFHKPVHISHSWLMAVISFHVFEAVVVKTSQTHSCVGVHKSWNCLRHSDFFSLTCKKQLTCTNVKKHCVSLNTHANADRCNSNQFLTNLSLLRLTFVVNWCSIEFSWNNMNWLLPIGHKANHVLSLEQGSKSATQNLGFGEGFVSLRQRTPYRRPLPPVWLLTLATHEGME